MNHYPPITSHTVDRLARTLMLRHTVIGHGSVYFALRDMHPDYVDVNNAVVKRMNAYYGAS